MHRRQFLKAGFAVAGSFALGRDFWKTAYAAPAVPGPGPFGPLLAADANGLLLPAGFTSRKIATAYQPVLRGDGTPTAYAWHRASDGGGVIPQADGGWIYVSNSEIPIVADEFPASTEQGGCGAVRFDRDGKIVDAYSILSGTNNNCAGGVTPWGTWLSCEENFGGFVYECDPTGSNLPLRLPAMGQFNHEAAAVDPVGKAIYMTEDAGDGAFYRFRPALWPEGGRPDLTAGILEVAVIGEDPPVRRVFTEEIREAISQAGQDPDDFPWSTVMPDIAETAPGAVTWLPVADPLGLPLNTRYQVPTAAVFMGGEGCWYDDGMVYITCKGSDRVWGYDTRSGQMDIVYDAKAVGAGAPLTGVDNLLVHPQSKDIFVAEDGGNMEICVISKARQVAPLMRYPVPHSEITGLAFDPSGTRLYFASQAKRHAVDEASGRTIFGEIFEISGPFQGAASPAPEPPAPVAPAPADGGRFGGGAFAGFWLLLLALVRATRPGRFRSE